MKTIHEEADALGILRPELEYEFRQDGHITVRSLTAASEKLWSNYLRDITLAKIESYKFV